MVTFFLFLTFCYFYRCVAPLTSCCQHRALRVLILNFVNAKERERNEEEKKKQAYAINIQKTHNLYSIKLNSSIHSIASELIDLIGDSKAEKFVRGSFFEFANIA